MARRGLAEQLDDAIQVLLTNPEAQLPSGEPSVVRLLRIAIELRDLPRESFRTQLKAELERKTSSMTTATGTPVREGFQTITPYLVVQDAAGLIDFVKQAFGGEELMRSTGSAGGIHCEIRLGDSMIMIGGGGAWRGTPMPSAIHLYVRDCDSVYQRAVETGATVLRAPQDQDYGDRDASVKDPFGNHWYIGTNKATGHVREGLRTATPYFHAHRSADVMDFLKRALGAEEIFRAESPEGTIHHAEIRIGDSVIEMGDAHAEFQPMPSMMLLYVDDADDMYQRAIGAGATSISEPAQQSYGRVGAVADPFGNQWYLVTQH